jgi:hypothetical protein
MSWLVIGVDPGPTPGIAALHATASRAVAAAVVQCDQGSTVLLVRALLSTLDPAGDGGRPPILAVERFVVGYRAARSRTAAAGAATRDLVGAVRAMVREIGARFEERPAAAVKPWASDARLAAAGLLERTRGLPHARDAARHALYAAVHAHLMPDPLSRRPRREEVTRAPTE